MRITEDPRIEPAYTVAVSFAVLLTGALVVRSFRLSDADDLLAMVVLVVLVAWWVRPVAAPIVGAIAFLYLDGFLVDSDAQLAWHGSHDVTRLLALVAAAVGAALVREVWLRRVRFEASLEGLLHD